MGTEMTLEEVDSVAKKKKVEVKKETSLWERRNRELKSLQSSITSLKKSITELEAKIDSQGIKILNKENKIIFTGKTKLLLKNEN